MLTGCHRQPGQKLYTIGVFQFTSSEEMDRTREGFLKAMQDGGYQEGAQVHYQFENAQADLPTTTLIAKKLAQADVDLIVPLGTPPLQAMLAQVKDRPIVFGLVANPYLLGAGEAADKHLPNVTGASATAPIGEGLELMHQVVPAARRVGIIYDPSNANAQWNMEVARKAAAPMGLTFEVVTISSSGEVLQAAQTLAARKVDVLFQIPDHIVRESADSLVKVADQQRIPFISTLTSMAQQGAAVAVGWDYFDNGYLTGRLAIRVMKGEKPADIPFQPLSKKLVYVNRAAAARQGLTLPPSLLKQAAKIIQ
jgi:ABC-type uncharacterized transport system substrate-binding protein